MKTVDAADAIHGTVPPRLSVTVTAPRSPVIVVVPVGALFSGAVAATDRVVRPPVREKVVLVSPPAAEAGRAVAPIIAAATASEPKNVVDLRMMCFFLFGSSADRVGPVALRPRLASGLPLSTSESRWQGT